MMKAKNAGAHRTVDEPTEQQTIFTEHWNDGRTSEVPQQKCVWFQWLRLPWFTQIQMRPVPLGGNVSTTEHSYTSMDEWKPIHAFAFIVHFIFHSIWFRYTHSNRGTGHTHGLNEWISRQATVCECKCRTLRTGCVGMRDRIHSTPTKIRQRSERVLCDFWIIVVTHINAAPLFTSPRCSCFSAVLIISDCMHVGKTWKKNNKIIHLFFFSGLFRISQQLFCSI